MTFKAALAGFSLLAAAPAFGADVVVTVVGTVSVDSYSFGPYQSAALGDAVAITFVATTPGTDVVPGQEVDYSVDPASLSVNINGSIAGAFSGSPTLTVVNDAPGDSFDITSGLSNGDFFGFQFDAFGGFLPSVDLDLLNGTYDLAAGVASQNLRFTGPGGFLGVMATSMTVSVPPTGYCIELIGSVLSNSYSSGPFGGVSSGELATLEFCVTLPGTVVAPNQLVNYAIELGTFDLDINGPTGVALGGPANLQIQNDFPAADGFRVNGGQLGSGEFFSAGFGALGTLFPSTDITQLAGTYDVASNLTSFNYVIQGGGGMMEIFPEILIIRTPTVSSNYCTAANNSTGGPSAMGASGSASVASNNFILEASDLPAGQFGIFLTSLTQGFVPGASGSSDGNLCLGGAIGRFTAPNQIVNSGTAGQFSLQVDLSVFPQGAGTVAVMPGQTWNFQAWHRDLFGLGSNFTDGLQVTFF